METLLFCIFFGEDCLFLFGVTTSLHATQMIHPMIPSTPRRPIAASARSLPPVLCVFVVNVLCPGAMGKCDYFSLEVVLHLPQLSHDADRLGLAGGFLDHGVLRCGVSIATKGYAWLGLRRPS